MPLADTRSSFLLRTRSSFLLRDPGRRSSCGTRSSFLLRNPGRRLDAEASIEHEGPPLHDSHANTRESSQGANRAEVLEIGYGTH